MSRVYRVTFKCHDVDDNSLVQPSLHYQTDLSFIGDEPLAADVAEGVWNLLGNEFRACCNNLIRIDAVVARECLQTGSSEVPHTGQEVVDALGTMTVANADLPREMVGIVNLRSEAAIRSGRGYMTMPGGYSESFLTSKAWSGTYLSNLQALTPLLDESFDLGTIDITHVHPVIFSQKRFDAGAGQYTFRVIDASANPRPKWRRSRGNSP